MMEKFPFGWQRQQRRIPRNKEAIIEGWTDIASETWGGTRAASECW